MQIEFEKDFAFNPDSLVKTINEVVLRNEIANGYYVEVVECQNEEVVYNFEIDFFAIQNASLYTCFVSGVQNAHLYFNIWSKK